MDRRVSVSLRAITNIPTSCLLRADRERLRATLAALNPGAALVESTFGAVPLSSVLNTKSFSLAAAAAAPGWLCELRGTHVPESVEYGISSFVYHARRPFHPARLHDVVYNSPALNGVLRSKGFFWLAVDGGMDDSALWSHAGAVFQFSTGRPWWATVPKEAWPPGAAAVLDTRAWDPTYGDRGQEIVFIGVGMDRAAIEAALGSALLTDSEFAAGRELWDSYEDPFDFFPYEGDDDEEDGDEDMGVDDGHEHGASCSHGHGHGHGHGHSHGHSHDSAPTADAHAVVAPSDEHGDGDSSRPVVRRIVRAGGDVIRQLARNEKL